jgi:hypothetical protein
MGCSSPPPHRAVPSFDYCLVRVLKNKKTGNLYARSNAGFDAHNGSRFERLLDRSPDGAITGRLPADHPLLYVDDLQLMVYPLNYPDVLRLSGQCFLLIVHRKRGYELDDLHIVLFRTSHDHRLFRSQKSILLRTEEETVEKAFRPNLFFSVVMPIVN